MRIAIIAPGAMGAATARRLHTNGATIALTLEGRSPASAARAAGMTILPSEAALATWADAVLAILPPGDALPLAQRLAPHLRPGTLYADCNAISPETVRHVAAALPHTRFIDAGIIGGPPGATGPGPRFYAAGPHAHALARLTTHGLDWRPMDASMGEGGIGAASALKMSYAGITKGLTALGSAMALGAHAAGAAPALHAELMASQPELMRFLNRAVPDMFDKAYRWVAEMEEISAFLGDSPASPIHTAMARLYQHLAADRASPAPDGPIARLAAFFPQA